MGGMRVENRTGVVRNLLRRKRRRVAGFTLVELLVAVSIALAALGTITYGYIQSYRMTDTSTLQAAAQRLAVERLEQVRSAEWKFYSVGINNLTNYHDPTNPINAPLDLPLLTSTPVMAEVTTEVQEVSTNPPLYSIRVSCVWTNRDGLPITNEVSTLRGPD
jgi:prepilin-type N-terminal cleavage/methylation domain-containing protein